MPVQRWTLYDYTTMEEYTFPRNPASMGSVERPRNITSRTTTAVDGQSLVTEGNAPPHQWSFEGVLLDHDQYSDLEDWTSRPRRIKVTDHFGRSFDVAFTSLNATPKRRVGYYWSHDYTVEALILTTPTAATVGV